jgi:uncharacterized phiE125 gp8 family phage protein
MSRSSIVTTPSTAVVATATLKEWLNILHTEDDTLLTSLCLNAGAHIQNITRRGVGAQQRKQPFWSWPNTNHYLEFEPITSVDSITYVDAAGAVQTLADTVYRLNYYGYGELSLDTGQSWPARTEGSPIWVTYSCGYTSATLPAELQGAIKLLVAYWYENREAGVASSERGAETAMIPEGFYEMLLPMVLR